MPEKPVGRASVYRMLRNPCYVKLLTWGGIQYPGAHPQLIDQDTFDRVQSVLDAHNLSVEKRRLHDHYLKGSVFCKCGSRLCITKAKNRHGTEYLYFFCLGNYRRLTDCQQKAIPLKQVEARIEQKWREVRFDPKYADTIRQIIDEEMAASRTWNEQETNRATNRIATLTEQRHKLLEAHDLHDPAARSPGVVRRQRHRVGEEPAEIAGLWKQRVRWARGNVQVTKRYRHVWFRRARDPRLGRISFGAIWFTTFLMPAFMIGASLSLVILYFGDPPRPGGCSTPCGSSTPSPTSSSR